MLRFIDLSFHASNKNIPVKEAIGRYAHSYGYTRFLKQWMEVEVLLHLPAKQQEIVDGITYTSLKGRNGFFNIPLNTLRYLRKQKPDIVLVQGMIYPVQVILLRFFLGRSAVVLVQSRGGKVPYHNLKLFFYKLADECVTGYMCTAIQNVNDWIAKNVIGKKKLYEIQGGSTAMLRIDKYISREKTGISGEYNFLWVAKLDQNKDPFTILESFAKYLAVKPQARLYMVFHTIELQMEIQLLLKKNAALGESVILAGKIAHNELAHWYSAADFFIIGSHREATGFALLEAMACGCIPIVTDIPPFRKITAEGKYGVLFKPGDTEDLYQKLLTLDTIDREGFSQSIIKYFNENLSYEKIAKDLFAVCKQLTSG